jgi:acyl carrier protein
MSALFDAPTISMFDAYLLRHHPDLLDGLALREGNENDTDVSRKLVPAPRNQNLPLSLGQERIWALAEMHPQSSVYNLASVFRLAGALDIPALERSLTEIQRRHEILRTVFRGDVSKPYQEVLPEARINLQIDDVSPEIQALSPSAADVEIQRLAQLSAEHKFDLQSDELWRATLTVLGKDDYLLALILHHMIFDGASRPLLHRELEALYTAFAADNIPELAPLDAQYADYACWQREWLESENAGRQLAYWTQQLAGLRALRLPTNHARSAATSMRGNTRRLTLPADLTGRLNALAREQNSSLYMTLLAGYCALLHRYTGQEDMPVCSPVASREFGEVEALIGYFNNVLVMRADLSSDPSFRELLSRMRRTVLVAQENQGLPLQKLGEIPEIARTPLTRAMFSHQSTSDGDLNLPGIAARAMELSATEADFELALTMESPGPSALQGVLEYNADLFDAETISQFVDNFVAVLDAVATDPEHRLSDLPRFGFDRSVIEATLTSHPQIDNAVVVENGDWPGSVAFLVLNEDDVPELDAVRAFARSQFPDFAVPVSFVPVDAFPLSDNGSVDIEKLPTPNFSRQERSTPFVAPRNALEETISRAWKKALWLDDDVGIDDEFADLGGHSLLSVQLAIELEKELSRPLPMRALSRLSTVADMAKILAQEFGQDGTEPEATDAARDIPQSLKISEDKYHSLLSYTGSWVGARKSENSTLVGFNTDGTKTPLFWCLQRYGELTQLAKYLGPDQPVYGMRSGHKIMEYTPDNIASLAAHHIDEIVAAKPNGPYIIAGHCQGAQIAFDIAEQMSDQGLEIPLLIMMEHFVAKAYRTRVALMFGRESVTNPYIYFKQPEIAWNRYYYGDKTVDIVPGKRLEFFSEPNIQTLAETVTKRIEQAGTAGDKSPKDASRDFQWLTPADYKVGISAPVSVKITAGVTYSLPVEITNKSTVTWHTTELSGLQLANLWIDENMAVRNVRDGRTSLPKSVAPGETVRVEHHVEIPPVPGRWFLDLDMVDEGIAWFNQHGSTPTRVVVDVQPNAAQNFRNSPVAETSVN